MKLADIKNGVVVNVVEVDPAKRPAFMNNWPEAGGAGIGWTYDGEAFFQTVPDPQVERAAMKPVSPLQGRLALGPQVCDMIDAIADDPDTPWQTRQTIRSATEWRRTSPSIVALGVSLGYSDEAMDELFRVAAQITV